MKVEKKQAKKETWLFNAPNQLNYLARPPFLSLLINDKNKNVPLLRYHPINYSKHFPVRLIKRINRRKTKISSHQIGGPRLEHI